MNRIFRQRPLIRSRGIFNLNPPSSIRGSQPFSAHRLPPPLARRQSSHAFIHGIPATSQDSTRSTLLSFFFPTLPFNPVKQKKGVIAKHFTVTG